MSNLILKSTRYSVLNDIYLFIIISLLKWKNNQCMLNLPLLALRSRYFNYILNMLSLKAKKPEDWIKWRMCKPEKILLVEHMVLALVEHIQFALQPPRSCCSNIKRIKWYLCNVLSAMSRCSNVTLKRG